MWGCFPASCWCLRVWGLFLPKRRTWCFPLSFMRFWFACFSSLSPSTWTAAYPAGASGTPPTWVSSADSAEGTLCLMVQVIREEIKRSWPQYRPLGHATRGWPLAGPLAVGHSPFSLAVQPVFSPVTVLLSSLDFICLFLGGGVKSCSEVEINNIHCSALLHQASHLLANRCQVG